MPKITFVMPIGRYDYLEAAVKSIFSQTLQDWELIIYNNKNIHFDVKDKRINVLKTRDWHPAKCYNNAKLIANSPYILIATDDDVSFAERAQITYDYLQKYDFFAGSVIETDKDLNPKKYIRVRPYKVEYQRRIANTISLPFAGYRRDKVPLFREDFKICYDYLFNLQCGMNGLNIKTSPIPLGLKRVWSDSAYMSTSKSDIESELQIIRDEFGDQQIRDHDEKITREFMRTT